MRRESHECTPDGKAQRGMQWRKRRKNLEYRGDKGGQKLRAGLRHRMGKLDLIFEEENYHGWPEEESNGEN